VCGDIRRRKASKGGEDAVDVGESEQDGGGVDNNGEVLCERQCGALLSCGRHRCSRHCCPLYPLTSGIVKGKSKKRPTDDPLAGLPPSLAQLHTCSLLCHKPLSCGNPEHKCLERDHRGPCPPCLRSSFEEVSCACGRTVLEPPVACGTVVECPFPCSLEPRIRECGHPRSVDPNSQVAAAGSHRCHEGGVDACPPCVYLSDKLCACGKKVVRNVRCGLGRERVGCGSVCGK
jgi:transcriptional repressor NF-X1